MGVVCYFDLLPDSIACLILSKLKNAQAVAQCATVCRRWRILAQSVDTLTFESFKLFEKRVDKSAKASCVEAIVSKVLPHTNGLRDLNISYHPVVWPWIPHDHFSEQTVCHWLKHVRCSLERLVLVDPNSANPQPEKLIHLSECKRLHWLNLCYGVIPDIPSSCRRFEHLKTCFLGLIVISDDALQTFVKLCPSLEDLKVNSCKGLQAPCLVAPNLLSLEFAKMDVCDRNIACVTVEAPKLVKVCLSYVEELKADGQAILELDLLCHVRPRLRHLPGLASLYLNGEMWELESILELFKLGTNLSKLHVDAVIRDKRPMQLEPFYHMLELRSLYLGADLFECLQAASVSTCNLKSRICLPKLEDVTAVVHFGNIGCVAVLAALLKYSTSLKTLQINARKMNKSMGNEAFFTNVLHLQKEYPQVTISLSCPECLI
ncbi:hypothetical protein O6H91_06G023400 [Diphasiastrum complanatum]|uniref:Uncharacterized protein n=1 Tax=Diphasiastrum complanatum TaxID=34168 RepID=A0ACC2DBI8_DIPCM|nr:hypothetical protein O6H91_Y029700 [Diphasiastrum complanatum]KAJ7551655.1 hypothetical protein O6H91_06G023400 [Diphasiastrum complanatum]